MEDKYVVTLKELMEKFPMAEVGTITLGWWDFLFANVELKN